MKRRFHRLALCVLPSGLLAARLLGQATPTIDAPRYEGFHLPTAEGSLNYAVTVSERIEHGYNGDNRTGYSTNIGGDLAYLSNSRSDPFSLVYSGGYLTADVAQPAAFYQNLALSQTLTLRRWTVVLDDAVSYLPQTPTAGLSGIPGVGDVGVPPVNTGVGDGQTILTQNASRVSNTFSSSVQRGLTGKTYLNAFGSYGLVDYPHDGQDLLLNTTQSSAGGGFSHRIDVRSSFSANYNYANFSSHGGGAFSSENGLSFLSQSLNVGFFHQFTRRASVDVALGPQRTSSAALPHSSYDLAANVAISYAGESSSYTASYNSGTNAGSGVAAGATSQNLSGTISRPLGRAWHAGASVGYSRSTSLALIGVPAFNTNSVVAAAQVNRAVGRNLSAFAGYTAQRQILAGTFQSVTPFSGLSQVLSFGLTYAPGSHHLGGH